MNNDEKVLHEFRKNAFEKVVTSLNTYRGQRLVNLRVYFKDGDDWKPTPKGLTLRRELIPDLKEAVDKAAQEYEKESLGRESDYPPPPED